MREAGACGFTSPPSFDFLTIRATLSLHASNRVPAFRTKLLNLGLPLCGCLRPAAVECDRRRRCGVWWRRRWKCLFLFLFLFWGVEPPHRVEQPKHGGGMPRGERPQCSSFHTGRRELMGVPHDHHQASRAKPRESKEHRW
jgi:hypothetical protein